MVIINTHTFTLMINIFHDDIPHCPGKITLKFRLVFFGEALQH